MIERLFRNIPGQSTRPERHAFLIGPHAENIRFIPTGAARHHIPPSPGIYRIGIIRKIMFACFHCSILIGQLDGRPRCIFRVGMQIVHRHSYTQAPGHNHIASWCDPFLRCPAPRRPRSHSCPIPEKRIAIIQLQTHIVSRIAILDLIHDATPRYRESQHATRHSAYMN